MIINKREVPDNQRRKIGFAVVILVILFMLRHPGIVTYASTSEDQGANIDKIAELSGLPQIYITTVSGSAVSGSAITTEYSNTAISFIDPQNNSKNEYEGKIKVRGNSTAEAPKKPYKIKLNSKQNIFGMGKYKKWVLLANAFDKTLIRNKLVFELANATCLDNTPGSKYVDVWVDGNYAGNYLLVDPIEVNDGRVDIDIDNNEYLLEIESERIEDGVTYIQTNLFGVRLAINEPEEVDQSQIDYLEDFFDQMEAALASGSYENYSQYIDLDSFIDFYIIEEYFKNIDVSFSSTRFNIKNNKLYAGPLWDFDLSSGNANPNYYTTYYTDSNVSYEGLWAGNLSWYNQLLKYDSFVNKLKVRYQDLQKDIVNLYKDNEKGINQIDSLIEANKQSFENNNTIWRIDVPYSSLERQPDPTYEENVEYLRKWLEDRNNWLISYWAVDITDNLNYTAYDAIIEYVNSLNKNDYLDFSELEEAICVNVKYAGIIQKVIDEQIQRIQAVVDKLIKLRIQLNKSDLEMKVGDNHVLEATVYTDADDLNPQVIWETSDNTVVTVTNDGKVTAVKEGQSTITARTSIGHAAAVCTVVVSKGADSPTNSVTPSNPVPIYNGGNSGADNNANKDGAKETAEDKNLSSGEKIIEVDDSIGWNKIIGYIDEFIEQNRNDTTEPPKIIINMNTTTILSQNLLEAMKDKNVDVALIMEDGIQWIINGKDINDSQLNSVDLAVKRDTGSVSPDLLNSLFDDNNNVVQISINHNGDFGFKATLRIDLKKENKGLVSNLYYYNPNTEQLTLQAIGEIGEDGTADLTFTHASDYVIVMSDQLIIEDSIINRITVNGVSQGNINQNTLYFGGTSGDTKTLKPELPPVLQEAVDKGLAEITLSYNSSNKKVATVSKAGKITAKAAGDAIITTTLTINGNQYTYKTKFTIKKAFIEFSSGKDSVKVGDTVSFSIKYKGYKKSDIIWKTTYKDRAVVGLNQGKTSAKITGRTKGVDYVVIQVNGQKVAKHKITVK